LNIRIALDLLMNLQKLEHSIKGKILSDKEILNYYSVDSSFYQIRPKLVVIPKNISDVVKIVKFANTNKLSVTARGGGTGLVGSALNDGIILDLQDLNKIKVSKNYVEVEPGVHKGKLDKILEKHGKFLGPNPSVGPYCTVGGMIATNASGSHSLKYGSMIENLLSVTFVTGKGKIIRLPSKTKLAHSILKLAHSIDRKKFPKISKNSCGYRLDSILNQNDSHKIIAASEGTLGIIVSAKLKTFKAPQKKSLLVIGYDSAKNALNDCQNLVKLNPSALEFVDSNTMKNIQTKFPPKIKSLLFVEFDSKIYQSVAKLKKICNGKILRKLDNTYSISKWWAYRNSALYFSLKNLLAGESLPHIIEDATVSLDKLNQLIALAEKTAKKFSARLVMYGHAGNGNIHIRLAAKKQDKTTMQRLAKTFFSEIIKMNGTITGEHGDGLARTKFVKLQYGAKNYDIFTRLKQVFDPNFVLNPNKIVTN
jgi:FAD/FMN-containing dehydrogenase